MEKQVLLIFAATNGYLDNCPVSECRRYEQELYLYFETHHPDILKDIATIKDLKGDLTERLRAALDEFGRVFQATPGAAAGGDIAAAMSHHMPADQSKMLSGAGVHMEAQIDDSEERDQSPR